VGSSAAAGSLPDDLRVERIGPERGLPSATITTVFRDRSGLMWFGTREGLVLYDGYSARVFEHAVADATSLSDNAIRTIHEDREGNLWIGTNTGGLDRLDRATWRFEHFRHDSTDVRSLSHDSVNAILEDREGKLWVGTQQGLNRFDRDTRRFERWSADADDPSTLPHDYVYSLLLDHEGAMWIATVGGGVARMDSGSRRFRRIAVVSPPSRGDRALRTFALAEGPGGRLFAGSEVGLYEIDRAAGLMRPATFAGGKDIGLHGVVTGLAFDRNGILWIGTWASGLYAVDLAHGDARAYRHQADRPDSLGEDRVQGLIADAGGDVWAGTWGGGVNRFHAHGTTFGAIVQETEGHPGLAYREATAVLEDRAGRLWVGTWGKGLHRRDPGRRAFDRMPTEIRGEEGNLDVVLALAEGAHGEIWAGAFGGLFRIDPATRTIHGFPRAPKDPNGLGPGYVTAVAVDRDDRLWVGVGGSGLYRLEPDGRSFARFAHNPSDPATLSDDYVTSLFEDQDGKVWVGTRSGGLNLLDPETGRFTRFPADPDDSRSLSHHYVVSVMRARRGDLWVGTGGGGLNRLVTDAGRSTFDRVGPVEGLVDGNVVSMLEDDDGSLWVATRRGLSRYDPTTGKVANYGGGDGLPSAEFNPAAACAGRTALFFGGAGGVLVVRRGTPFDAPQSSPTVVTSIRTLAGPLTLPTPPWSTRAIDVSYGTALAFEFAVLDYRSRHRFEYRYGDAHGPWLDLGPRRELTFVDLSPGSHVLSIRGRNAQGVWSETEAPIAIRVVPPFWMTGWFRGLAILAVAALGLGAHRFRTVALERRNRELETLQHEREEALREARKSQAALNETYARLRTLSRRLEDAREEERRGIARELHDEMGQALTAVKLNLKALGRSADVPSVPLADTIGLVEGMIGQIRAMSLDLRPPLLDELGLVPAVRSYAEGQALRTGLRIVVESSDVPRGLPPPIAIVAFRLVQEALSNVVRHAGASAVTVSLAHADGTLRLRVDDDGCGFAVAETFARAAHGGHLGLLGMRERAEALGGAFEVKSTPGGGTTVRLAVPLTEGVIT
jgi:signal transduction histidine kinase/ligand-binding sensor domain-containing protein